MMKLAVLFTLALFLVACCTVGEAKGTGRAGGARVGTVKSAPKAPAKAAPVVKTPPKTVADSNTTNNNQTKPGVATRIKDWFNSRSSTASRGGTATATNNYYYSNGRYNGWNGIFWGYLMGRALAPQHTTNANAQQQNEYTIGDNGSAGQSQAWAEPTVGDNIISYGVLILFVVAIVLLVRLVYKAIKKRTRRNFA